MNPEAIVIMPAFEIHTTSLEKIIVDANSIEICLDDVNEERYRIVAKPYQAIKITTIDCASSDDFHNDFCFRDGRYHRHILQMLNSHFLKELKEKAASFGFLTKSKHFVFPLQEIVVELIAYELNVTKQFV